MIALAFFAFFALFFFLKLVFAFPTYCRVSHRAIVLEGLVPHMGGDPLLSGESTSSLCGPSESKSLW